MTHTERHATVKGALIGFFATLVTCIAFFLSIIDDSKKDYPIGVIVKHGSYGGTINFDADSVKSDTIYNNGLYIVNKNIINVVFK